MFLKCFDSLGEITYRSSEDDVKSVKSVPVAKEGDVESGHSVVVAEQ